MSDADRALADPAPTEPAPIDPAPTDRDTPPDIGAGSDVEVDPKDLEGHDIPATSDPKSFVEDADLGGVGGSSSGGAG